VGNNHVRTDSHRRATKKSLTMRKPELRVVASKPQFDLRQFETNRPSKPETPNRRRPPRQMTTKFARLPYTWNRRLHEHRVNANAWYLLMELDRLIHQPGKGNPIKLTAEALKSTGLSPWAVKRALRHLEKAGAVSVTHHRGRTPIVDILWYWIP